MTKLSIVAALACAAALAACGSSRSPNTQSAHVARSIKFADCMRSHGVPNFPDPGPGGGIQLSDDINPSSPSFIGAQGDCAKLLPFGGPGSQKPSEQAEKQMLQEAQCMRAHGVSGFPDPTFKRPSSPAGYSQIEILGGVVMAIPDTINVGAPAFKQAAKVCNFS